MVDASISDLKAAVESQYGGTAKFVQSVPVREAFPSQQVWEGVVNIFELTGGHSQASRAYAWSYSANGGRARIFIVAHGPSVGSPVAAVRSAIATESRDRKTNR